MSPLLVAICIIGFHLRASPSDACPIRGPSVSPRCKSYRHLIPCHWCFTKAALNLLHVGFMNMDILGISGCSGLIITAHASEPILFSSKDDVLLIYPSSPSPTLISYASLHIILLLSVWSNRTAEANKGILVSCIFHMRLYSSLVFCQHDRNFCETSPL